MDMEKVIVDNMPNGVMMRVLDRGSLVTYWLCQYSRSFFAVEVEDVVVNLF